MEGHVAVKSLPTSQLSPKKTVRGLNSIQACLSATAVAMQALNVAHAHICIMEGSIDSGCHKVSEDIWFAWSKLSKVDENPDVTKISQVFNQTNNQREDRATQLLTL